MTDTVERLSPALAGRYVVDRKIGEGGMATVYLARDVRHNRKVAIKVFHPELSAMLGAERFLQEIELTANLQHPHILPLFDSGSADGLLYYVMPYVDGESLRARLDRERQLPVNEAINIACDVAGALEYAHKRGVVHRDIKPENILLYEGRPVVADFGIALAVEKAGGTRMTQTGMSLGTPHYMAPEQAMGERDITPRSDIYALGAVLYEMLVGEPPFTGPTSQAVIARVVTEEPRSLVVQRKSVPPHVEAAVHTALAKIPADRFSSAAQFGEALTRVDYAPTATQRTYAAAAPQSVRARAVRYLPWAIAAGALAAVAFMALQSEPKPVTWQRVVIWQWGAPVDLLGRFVALSPDGRTIAYVDSVGGKNQIWIKEDRQLDAVAIAGTTNAVSPTFSPDGRWLAFAEGGKMKKVPRVGGAAITIGDSAGAIPPTAWLDDGTVLFVNNGVGALYAVPEAGGPQRRVLSVSTDTVPQVIVSVSPVFGNHAVLVGMCTPGCAASELHRVDVRTGKRTLLTADALKGWYVDGHVVFVRQDGGVFAVPYSGDDDSFQTAPFPVLNGVRTSATVADMAIAANGTLMYVAGPASGGVSIEPVWVTRSGAVSRIDSGWSFLIPANNGFALSPDGRRLAVGARIGGAEDIWIKTLDRGPLARLTFDGSNPRPWWSRDGTRVFYLSTKRGGNSDVRYRRADGTGAEGTLLDLGRQIFEIHDTNDTTRFVVRVGQPPSRDIGLARVGDTTFVPLMADPGYDEVAPMLSPNRRWLTYASNETGRFEIYVRPFPDVNAGKWQVSRSGGAEPYWAHNGRELFFRSQTAMMVAAVTTGETFSVGEVKPLFNSRGLRFFTNARMYDVTGDDSRFVFTRNFTTSEERETLWVVMAQNWASSLRDPQSAAQAR